uniref:Uncharacterized protein n=1 Tax=Kalanchoe fedtschenkoi TaxID=63787 RepID=A0A7N0SX03_KALFE
MMKASGTNLSAPRFAGRKTIAGSISAVRMQGSRPSSAFDLSKRVALPSQRQAESLLCHQDDIFRCHDQIHLLQANAISSPSISNMHLKWDTPSFIFTNVISIYCYQPPDPVSLYFTQP